MSKPTNIVAVVLLAVLALLAAGWIYGALTNWNGIAGRPVRLAYIVADFAIVIPIGVVAAVGLLRNRRWAPTLTGIAIGALLFDIAHGVFYQIWDNYFGIPILGAFGVLAVVLALAVVATVVIARPQATSVGRT